MARLDINKPYEDFLKSQVKSGLFRSITAAAEDAIRKQMYEYESRRIESVLSAVAIGEKDVKEGKTKTYSPTLISEIAEIGRKIALNKDSEKNESF
jgi:Arc/MetJ-type ribon-helix-helix transcriptional regulator